MANLMQAHHEWASRPEDQRFVSLTDLQQFTQHQRSISKGLVRTTSQIEARPVEGDDKAIVLYSKQTEGIAIPTHWSFGQLAQRAGAPASYLRDLPAPLAADCINYGLVSRDVEDLGLLVRQNGGPARLAAVTGPGYGRIWNHQIVDALVNRFGDGLTGDFKIPGEFGKRVEINKSNTTLFASDRDMFVFLADEEHRIEIPNRRDGKSGSMARGFFVWNSEVGSSTFGIATFLFDYVCCNRIVWGADGYKEIKIRHTGGAPERWIREVTPALKAYASSSTKTLDEAIKEARKQSIKDKVEEFLTKRFTRSQAEKIQKVHLLEEHRPIETMWDAVVGATAYARGIEWQDERVKIEREAGKLLAA